MVPHVKNANKTNWIEQWYMYFQFTAEKIVGLKLFLVFLCVYYDDA